jgi:hypothetical protein
MQDELWDMEDEVPSVPPPSYDEVVGGAPNAQSNNVCHNLPPAAFPLMRLFAATEARYRELALLTFLGDRS